MTTGTKRSVLNMQSPAWFEMQNIFIDFLVQGDGNAAGYLGFAGTAAQTDVHGFQSVPSSLYVAAGTVSLPPSLQYSGNYIFIGRGSGVLNTHYLGANTTLAVQAGGSGYTGTGTGPWTVDSDTSSYTINGVKYFRIILARTDNIPYSAAFAWAVTSTNTAASGYMTDLHMYRADDESDFLAGYKYRSVFKQLIVDMNPSYIRFMNWLNDPEFVLWSNRQSYQMFFGQEAASYNVLPYAAATYSGQTYSVAGLPQTPATYKHGEIVWCQLANDYSTPGGTTAGGDGIAVMVPDTVVNTHTNVTCQNVNAVASYHVGDVIQFFQVQGMDQIDLQQATIQTIGLDSTGAANNKCFTVNIDSRTYSAFARGGNFAPVVNLNVGNRGNVPIFFLQSLYPVSFFGQGFMYWAGHGNSTRPFIFNKTQPGSRNSDGTVNWGVWMCVAATGVTDVGYGPPPAFEHCVNLINELEAMIIAQGKLTTHGPINMWVNVPLGAMLGSDPDYQQSDHIGIGMATIALNGNMALGVAPIPQRCNIAFEWSNETWNGAGITNWMAANATWRWGPAVAGYISLDSQQAWTALRAIQLFADIKSVFPNHPQIKYIMAGQEVDGIGVINNPRINGISMLLTDSASTAIGLAGTSGAGIPTGATPTYYSVAYGNTTKPATLYDYFATAPYLDPSGAYANNGYWNKFTTYVNTQYIIGSDNNTYQSSIDGNTGHDPISSPSQWTLIGASVFASSLATWRTNGQKAISSISQTDPAVITTTTAHGFSNGDLVVISDFGYVKATGFIDDGTGNGTPSGVAGSVLTVTSTQAGSLVLVDPSNINNRVVAASIIPGTLVTSDIGPTGGGGHKWQLNASQLVTSTSFYVTASDWNNLAMVLFQRISNVNSTQMTLPLLPSSGLSPIATGNVTRINGNDQETVYQTAVQWMINSGFSSQDINSVLSRVQLYCNTLVPLGASHINYEGWEETNCQSNNIPFTDLVGFVGACKQSVAMGTNLTTMMNNKKNVYGSIGPGVFTYNDPGTWGFTLDNAYACSTGPEWGGMSPSWSAMGTYNNAAYSIQLKITTT